MSPVPLPSFELHMYLFRSVTSDGDPRACNTHCTPGLNLHLIFETQHPGPQLAFWCLYVTGRVHFGDTQAWRCSVCDTVSRSPCRLPSFPGLPAVPDHTPGGKAPQASWCHSQSALDCPFICHWSSLRVHNMETAGAGGSLLTSAQSPHVSALYPSPPNAPRASPPRPCL